MNKPGVRQGVGCPLGGQLRAGSCYFEVQIDRHAKMRQLELHKVRSIRAYRFQSDNQMKPFQRIFFYL